MKKVQLYIDEHKDRVLHELVGKLEEEGQGTRGYVTDRLKDRLKTFELLARRFGEDDPTGLAIKLSSGNPPTPEHTQQQPKEEVKKTNKNVLDIGDAAMFLEEEE